jgi:hypothetical protein
MILSTIRTGQFPMRTWRSGNRDARHHDRRWQSGSRTGESADCRGHKPNGHADFRASQVQFDVGAASVVTRTGRHGVRNGASSSSRSAVPRSCRCGSPIVRCGSPSAPCAATFEPYDATSAPCDATFAPCDATLARCNRSSGRCDRVIAPSIMVERSERSSDQPAESSHRPVRSRGSPRRIRKRRGTMEWTSRPRRQLMRTGRWSSSAIRNPDIPVRCLRGAMRRSRGAFDEPRKPIG